MSVKFTNYLATRFNVPVKNWDKDKAGQRVLDDTWMKARLSLFTTYCAPTIARQSVLDFKWLIYCDVNTSVENLATIQQAIHSIPGATIRKAADFDMVLTDFRNLLEADPSPYIITSRLDNDDGLGPDFICDVQASFVPTDKMIINFTKGVLYDLQKHVLTEVRSSPYNHYGSLIEVKQADRPYLTIFGYPHGQPPDGSSVINLHNRFAWLKIIHHRNMVSRTNGWPLHRKHIIRHFDMKESDLTQSWLSTAVFVVIRLLSKIKRTLFPTHRTN
jgi:hypothetical protein